MSLLCLFGFHKRSIHAIARKQDSYISVCENCARPMVKQPEGRWAAAEPLYGPGSPP